jgi:CsoR family transcriptional regulator, copper-sensing transcriptional repressor
MQTNMIYLDEAAKRKLLNRLSRVEGQVRAMKEMVGEARCADDILVQAAAARGALGQFIARLLETHLADCVNSCMEGDRTEISERVSKAIATALKLSS